MPQKKSPVTPPGIDPGTFRLVAQCLYPCTDFNLGIINVIFLDNVSLSQTGPAWSVAATVGWWDASLCYLISNIISAALTLSFKHQTLLISTALLVGRSRDRSPVVSLGIFSVASDKSMCPGSTQPLKMSTKILLGVKMAGAYGWQPTIFKCWCHGIWKP
jgi:hypothetical protein